MKLIHSYRIRLSSNDLLLLNELKKYRIKPTTFVRKANEGEEIKYAFADKNYDDTNVEEGGHESIFVTTYGLIIGPNNNKDFTDYLEAAGLEEEECMGSFEQYLMEGDEVSKYKIEL
mgnify:CR=1 FL=1